MPDFTMTTERLLLRPFTPDDARSIAQLVSGACGTGGPEDAPPHASVAEIEERLAFNRGWKRDGSSITFAVCLTKAGTLIGTSTLMRIDPDHRNAMLSLWIAPRYRGEGYGTEAASGSIAYAFESLALHQVQAIRLQENQLSERLMKRLGMEQKGTIEDAYYHNGTYYDGMLHAVIRVEQISR